MKFILLTWVLIGSVSSFAAGKIEIVEEVEHRETRRFCSKKSEAVVEKQCDVWLGKQKKSLGDRLLTYYCGSGEHNEKSSSCLYQSVGEIKYVLRKYRTESVGK